MDKKNNLIKSQYINNNISYFHLVWLDDDNSNNDQFNIIIQDLKEVIYNFQKFSTIQECFDYISEIQVDEENVILIYSGEHVENIISVVNDFPQIDSTYILQQNKSDYKQNRYLSPKVNYDYVDLISICKLIKQTIRIYYQGHTILSYLQSDTKTLQSNDKGLESSFIYTSILKEIFLDPNFKPKHFDEFITYWGKKYDNNTVMLKKIEDFKQKYHIHDVIRWYTKPGFISSHLNEALRTMNMNLIIKFDFFIRDLHQQIASLHFQQYGNGKWESFYVYRGLVAPLQYFDKLRKTEGKLLSFNNFLSTSLDQKAALMFATPGHKDSNEVGVLFRIKLDCTIETNAFAKIQETSDILDEEEILFSMHSVFRLMKMQKRDDIDDDIWDVDLILTTDTDEELNEMTENIRQNAKGDTPWERAGHLMIKMNLPQQAEVIYKNLLDNTKEVGLQTRYLHQLGVIETQKGDLDHAMQYYLTCLTIYNDIDNSAIVMSAVFESKLKDKNSELYKEHAEYIPLVKELLEKNRYHLSMGPYSKATTINNIGELYKQMGKFHLAIEYFEKALEMRKGFLSPHDPVLAASYCSTGIAYSAIGKYDMGISYIEKALDIQKQCHPINYCEMAISCHNLGLTYFKIGEHSKAFQSFEEALKIFEKFRPENHPDIANSYDTIAVCSSKMGRDQDAMLNHQRALKMRQAYLPENQSETAISYNNIGIIHFKSENYSEAISNYEKAIKIQEQLSGNHHKLAILYWMISEAYDKVGEYSMAKFYCEKATKMEQQCLSDMI